MGKLVVVEGAILTCDNPAITAAINALTSILDANVKSGGNKAYNTLGFNASAPGYVTTPYIFSSSSTKAFGKLDGFVLKDQTVAVSLPLSSGTGPNLTGNVSIANPGQSVFKVE